MTYHFEGLRTTTVLTLVLVAWLVGAPGVRAQGAGCGDGVIDPNNQETCDPPAQPVSSGNLVQDGSFEAGTPNPFWTEFSTNFGTPLCDPGTCGFDLAADGSWWVWFGGTTAPEEGIVSQPVNLPAGSSATLQFSLWLITCSGEASDFFEVSVNGGVVFTVDLTDARCSNSDYSVETVDLTAFAGQMITLEFRAVTGTTGVGGNIFMDLVSLEVFQDATCRDDCTYCGDGVVDPVESCEPNDDAACPGQCDASCQCPALTGACCTDGPGTSSPCVVLSQQECESGGGLYLGDGMQCVSEAECVSLLVTMDTMSATATPGGVLVRWSTLSEVDSVGFRVLRDSGDVREKRLQAVSGLIPAAGNSLTGASYQFLDNSKPVLSTVRYYIEDIDIYGRVTRHGPIAVDRPVRSGKPGRGSRQGE